MVMRLIKSIILVSFIFCIQTAFGQDTTGKQVISEPLFDSSSVAIKGATPVKAKQDSVIVKKKHDPQKATLRSAILPGWGQAYNREYWKIPIVYGALAIPVATYIYNNTWYKKTKFAYQAIYNATIPPIGQRDSSLLPQIDPKLRYSDGTYLSLQSIQNYRNQFKKDKDYSVLWFFIIWGINVVDATVFGHLKDFDVSDELSMKVQPVFDPMIKKPGIGLVFNLKNPPQKISPFAR